MKNENNPYNRNKNFSYKASFWSMIAIIFTISFLAITQCEKEKGCYVCTVKTTWNYIVYTVTSEKEYPYCGVTEQFIKDFEIINTYSDTTTRMIQTCKCK